MKEYFTMVMAGLAGSTSYMISGTIQALSRLCYEFREELEHSFLNQMLGMILYFFNGNNREIVNSALVFVKIAIISFPMPILKENLSKIVEGLVKWSHEYKSHYRVKARIILERLIRKFGFEEIQSFVPDELKKMVLNIKKRRERAKRRNEATNEQEEVHQKENPGGNAFEQAVYDSESQMEDDKDKEDLGAWIQEDEDEPIDFLDQSAVSKITSNE